jgi:V/A-type H+-transporting ATPase subunit D
MSKKIIKGIRPTRIELLKLRKRELLARKGHDLLEEKRDAMIVEFLRIVEDFSDIRRMLEDESVQAFEKLTVAQMLAGEGGVTDAACAVPDRGDIPIRSRHIMGVPVPVIGTRPDSRLPGGRGYGYTGTTAALDEAADSFDRLLALALRAAESESTLRRIAQEIEKTKRRVNALETVLIPQIAATQKHIESHLEELERENLFRRKRTKLLHRRKAADEAGGGGDEGQVG